MFFKPNLIANIKFIYLYRDSANYKSWNDVVFENPDQLPLEEIENNLISDFLPDKLFVANQIFIPEKFLFSEGDFSSFDHCYHEFDHVEFCTAKPTDTLNRSIAIFLRDVRLVSEQGWKAFDILEYAKRQR